MLFANPIICPLDRPDLDGTLALARSLVGAVGCIKLGLEFIHGQGPQGVRRLADAGLPIFLDAKLHDIPNTVAGAMRGIVGLPVCMVTVMAQGGGAMMRQAVEIASDAPGRPWVLAVTVLTSLDSADLVATGIAHSVTDQALRLADLALEAGCTGIVCSPLEVEAMRRRFGNAPKLIVPGIRPEAGGDDQKRTLSPQQALAAGADLLVIGRPITKAGDPVQAARSIAAGLRRAA